MPVVFETAEAVPAPEQAVARPRARLAAQSYFADGTPTETDAEIIGAVEVASVDSPAAVAPVVPAEVPAAAVGPVQAAVAEATPADQPAPAAPPAAS